MSYSDRDDRDRIGGIERTLRALLIVACLTMAGVVVLALSR